VKENKLFVEGGGDTSALKTRCREGFRKLLENSGMKGHMPRIVACGSRNDAYDSFSTEHKSKASGYVGLLVDSEDTVANIAKPWEHLKVRDAWERPTGVRDDQALLMTTCMETWIIADRASLKKHYGSKFKETALPPLTDLEKRHRHDVQDALMKATRDCANSYAKDKRSFDVLSALQRQPLEKLPSFQRVIKILEQNA